MDLSKYAKPIHITCPKCHTDLEFNGRKIVADKNLLKDEICTLKARMQTHRNEYGKDPYYYSLLKELREKEAHYTRVKQLNQLIAEQSEIQLFILFKKACMKKYGREEITKLLIECENEVTFRTEELAKQNHNNFNGA